MDPKRAKRLDQDRVWVEGLLAQAQSNHFFGKLVITLEDGQVRRVIKEESLKPPSEP